MIRVRNNAQAKTARGFCVSQARVLCRLWVVISTPSRVSRRPVRKDSRTVSERRDLLERIGVRFPCFAAMPGCASTIFRLRFHKRRNVYYITFCPVLQLFLQKGLYLFVNICYYKLVKIPDFGFKELY